MPYSPHASGSGIVQRQRSGTWRRICGAIFTPRQSATAAASAIAAPSPSRSPPTPPPISCPASARPPNVTTPPISVPSANVALAASVAARRASPSALPIVSTIEKPHGDHAPVTPAIAAVIAAQTASAAQHGTIVS